MARIAKKDGIAFEPVGVVPGDDTVVRREVRAGSIVPENWQLEDTDTEEVPDTTTGLGAAPSFYKEQLDPETREVKEEHAEQGDAVEKGGARPIRGRGRKPESGQSPEHPAQQPGSRIAGGKAKVDPEGKAPTHQSKS